MAKKINLKAQKAVRNKAYALQFKKTKKRPHPRAEATFPSSPSTTTVRTIHASGHEAVCNACGVNTTVPFKPTPGRTVLCRPCFDKAA